MQSKHFYRFPQKKWQKLFEAHSRTKIHQKRVKESKIIIEDALKKADKWQISFSGGKDSAALVALASEISKDFIVWSQKDDTDISFAKPYCEFFCTCVGVNIEFARAVSAIKNNPLADSHTSAGEDAQYFFDLAKEAEDKVDGVMMGLRIEESKARKFNYSKYTDAAYRLKSGKWRCNPLMRWKGEDVFAFLISRGLPILDVYQRIELWEPPDPRKIRYDSIMPGNFAHDGRLAWLFHHYPDEYARLHRLHHEIGAYK